MIVPHRGNAFRPHAIRHKALSTYLVLLLIAQIFLGVIFYSGPEVKGVNTDRMKSDIILLANLERQKNNVSPLHESQLLNFAATKKLNNMFEENYWDHVGPNGETAWLFMENSGYHYQLAGENLARGFDSPQKVMTAWMNSPTHRNNILNHGFQEIGIAVGDGKINGAITTIIVQLFAKPQTALAAPEATTQVQAAQTLIPEISLENATTPSRAPYLIIWLLIFGLIVIDGLMLKRLGLHTSPKHLFGFRVSLLLSIFMLTLLSVGIAAIA